MEYLKNNLLSPLDYFVNQLKRTPSSKAVTCKGDSLTFNELDILSNKLAHFMLESGVKRREPIGLLINKDIRTIVGILAAWKIGCPYVPIDIEAPAKRIAYILDRCNISFVIADGKRVTKWPSEILDNRHFLLSEPNTILDSSAVDVWDVVFEYSGEQIPGKQLPCDLAYIIFTSGSTGTPKGVMITVSNLSFFIQWCIDNLYIKNHSIALNIANFSFDQSVMDIAFLVGCGAELHLYNSIKHPVIISNYIKENQIQIVSSVPSFFGTLLDKRHNLSNDLFSSLEKVFIGGAACPADYVTLFGKNMSNADIYNMYGPTEITVYCFFYKFKKEELADGVDVVSIGKPFANHYAYIIDEQCKPTTGQGELVVHGPQVMKGYLQDNLYRDEVLKRIPMHTDDGYRTGDIVKEDSNGNFYFVGRTDDMVKSGGYRIDLNEIEFALKSIDGVKEAAVITVPDLIMENLIMSFIILKNGIMISEEDINFGCASIIPNYMIPKRFIFIEKYPLNAAGKINKKALINYVNVETDESS